MEIADLNRSLPSIESSVSGLKKNGSTQMHGPCPKCGGTDRFFIILSDNKFGCRNCHPKPGDAVDFHQWMHGTTIPELRQQYGIEHVPPLNAGKRKKARPIPANLKDTYKYRDATGKYLFEVHRFEEPGCDKTFQQWVVDHMTGTKKTPKQAGVDLMPYNWNSIHSMDDIVIVEGEKDVRTLIIEGVAATTTPMGAKNFKADYAQYFKGKNITIIPDQDPDGTIYKEAILKHCLGVAASVKVVNVPQGKDVSDFLSMGGTVSQLLSMANAAPLEMPGQADDVKIPSGINAADLLKKFFPEPKWAVKNILPEGLTILGGKPKAGKSILALNLCLQIALGGKAMQLIPVERGTTLYLALEDVQRRLKERIGKMLEFDPAPANLMLYTDWPRLGEGGARALDKILSDNTDTRLLVIDTLAKIRPPQKSNGNLYSDDYSVIDTLKRIADRHEVSVLIVHHLRKMEGEDVFDTFSGTLGLTGAADGLMVMRRNGTGQMILSLRGRDIEEQEYVLEFDPWMFGWKIAGKAVDVKSTDEKQKLFDCLKEAGGPLTPKEIEDKTGLRNNYIQKTLPALLKEGTIQKPKRGQYQYIDIGNNGYNRNNGNNGNNGNNPDESVGSIVELFPPATTGNNNREQLESSNDKGSQAIVPDIPDIPTLCGNNCKYADLENQTCIFELITGGDDEATPLEKAAENCPARKGIES